MDVNAKKTNSSEIWETLWTLVERIKANRQRVPEEVLQTRFKKSFDELLEDTRKVGTEVFHRMAFSGFVFRDDEQMENWGPIASAAYEELKKEGLAEATGRALSKFCDVTLLLLYANRVSQRFERKGYMDYWLKSTRLVDGVYINDIVDMKYDADCGVWFNESGEFCLYWPPTRELYLKDLQAREADLEREIEERTHPSKIVTYIAAGE